MVDYIEAIKRPFSDLKKSGLAALLIWIPIVNFLSYGYFLDCAKTSIENKKELPEWGSNWREKFVRGLLYLVIRVIYMLPLFIISVFVLVRIAGELTKDNYLQAVGTGNPVAIFSVVADLLLEPGIIGILIFAAIIGIIISYFVPMAVIMYTINWRFKEAFNFKEISKRVLTKQYLIAWLVVAIYSMLVIGIGGFIPFVGGIIAMTLVGITNYTIFGSIYNEIKV